MLKLIAQQMSKAFRDSGGGGLMERFEAVSKLLFTKIIDQKRAEGAWNGLAARPIEMIWRAGDTERAVYERTRAVWREATNSFPTVFAGDRAEFPEDVSAVAKVVEILGHFDLAGMPSDVKGAVYEELLRNTFEKNENQQYFTPRQVVDFMVELVQPRPDEYICDPACGSGGFLVGALSHALIGSRDPGHLRLAGAEVDDRMAWIARINMLMHGADPASIRTIPGAGSLAPLDKLRGSLEEAEYSLILTNPPFGSDMTDRDALRSLSTGQGRTSRRRGVLFLERCLSLLKPGGRLGIILDDSVLNLPSNRDVRDIVAAEAIVEAVISLPDVTFMPYSTAKSSILLLRRKGAGDVQGAVFMADVENVGNRPNGDPLYSDEYDERGERKLKTDLPKVFEAYRRWSGTDERLEESFAGTTVFTTSLATENADGRMDVFYFHPARRHAQRLLESLTGTVTRLGDLVSIVSTSVNPSQEYGDESIRWIGLGDIESGTGRFEAKDIAGDRVRSNAHVFQPDDVLYSRLRPKLRKSVLIPQDDEGGVCSAELLVLRTAAAKKSNLLSPYLAYLLRSDLTYGQLIYQVTGVGRPRVSAQAIRDLQVPVPSIEEQARLVEALHKADASAMSMRREASELLDQAQATMEQAYEDVLRQLQATAVPVGSMPMPQERLR